MKQITFPAYPSRVNTVGGDGLILIEGDKMKKRREQNGGELWTKVEKIDPTSSSISRSRALNFSSNCPLIPEPAIMAARSIDRTRLCWRD